jgi:hypothetical protein
MPTIQETIKKVREFGDLAEGWHFGGGVTPSADRIAEAVHFLTLAEYLGANRSNAFPGASGQVEITFYGEDRMLEITFEADGSLTVAEDQSNEQVFFLDNITRGDAFKRLWEFTHNVWASSELSIENIMTRNVRVQVLPVRHLIHDQGNRYLWWSTNAQLKKTVMSAHISLGTTVVKLANPRFTGAFWTTVFPPNVAQRWPQVPLGTTAIATSTAGEEILSEEYLGV